MVNAKRATGQPREAHLLVVGFGHRARQGKNTAALALVECFPLDTDIRLVSFADALKLEVNRMARQVNGFRNLPDLLREAYGAPEWVKAEDVGKQRTILQWWGTDYRRAKDKDYWVRQFFQRLAELKPDVAVATDVRFPNEADAIKAAGGVVIKVTRLGKPDIDVPDHPSEYALDNYRGWDFDLQAKTVPELKEKVRATYAEIVRRSGPIPVPRFGNA